MASWKSSKKHMITPEGYGWSYSHQSSTFKLPNNGSASHYFGDLPTITVTLYIYIHMQYYVITIFILLTSHQHPILSDWINKKSQSSIRTNRSVPRMHPPWLWEARQSWLQRAWSAHVGVFHVVTPMIRVYCNRYIYDIFINKHTHKTRVYSH